MTQGDDQGSDPVDDERFDALLREAARGYNAPPPTPADAMWAAIEARRRAARAGDEPPG